MKQWRIGRQAANHDDARLKQYCTRIEFVTRIHRLEAVYPVSMRPTR